MNEQLFDRWERDLVATYPNFDGGWWMAVVCCGSKDEDAAQAHDPELLSYAYSVNAAQEEFSAPWQTVQTTRSADAVDVPGMSRESIRFACPTCSAKPSVDRSRWGQIIAAARRGAFRKFNVAGLD